MVQRCNGYVLMAPCLTLRGYSADYVKLIQKVNRRYLLCAVWLWMLAGCGTVSLAPQAESVRIVFNNDDVSKCQFIGEVTGSRGYWYNYLFISNEDMIRDALIDLRNKTYHAGGNTIKLTDQHIKFTTSVTFWGQAYSCE